MSTRDVRVAQGAENPVSLHKDSKIFTGYAVEQNDGVTEILVDDTRYIVHLNNDDILERYTCHESTNQLNHAAPLGQYLFGWRYASPNSDCDDLEAYLYAAAAKGARSGVDVPAGGAAATPTPAEGGTR